MVSDLVSLYPFSRAPHPALLEWAWQRDPIAVTCNPYLPAELADRILDGLARGRGVANFAPSDIFEYLALTVDQRRRIWSDPALRAHRASLLYHYRVPREWVAEAFESGDLSSEEASAAICRPTNHGLSLVGDPLLDELVAAADPLSRLELLAATAPGRFADELAWLPEALEWMIPRLSNPFNVAEFSRFVWVLSAQRPDLTEIIQRSPLVDAQPAMAHALERQDRPLTPREPFADVTDADADIERRTRECAGPDSHGFGEVCTLRRCVGPVDVLPVLDDLYQCPAVVDYLADALVETPDAVWVLISLLPNWEGGAGDLIDVARSLADQRRATG